MARTTTKTTTKAPAKAAPAQRSVRPAVAAGGAAGRSPRRFLREVRVEMGKVTWPPRPELIQATWVVLIAVAIAAAYIGLLDLVWSQLVSLARLG
ncbi:MAG: hypothetical protein Kow00122_20790 [Thermoleophilia bacterium]|nr:preprotein translocase subunit SecE [Actinomycetota bacterium]